ncbi:unnamed protein product, partial [Closterium sp. NIES-53]
MRRLKSRGDAITRLVRVLNAVIVLLWEWDDDFYHIVTSVKFNLYLYYLADMLIVLNNLSMEFQKREVHILCKPETLSIVVRSLLKLYLVMWQVDMTSVQSTVRRTLITICTRYIACGDDFDGGPQQHLGAFLARLSNKTPDDLQSCLDICRRHAKLMLSHLQTRLGDLESLNDVRIFMPDTYPEDKEGRAEECLEHFETLVDLFHAHERADILP